MQKERFKSFNNKKQARNNDDYRITRQYVNVALDVAHTDAAADERLGRFDVSLAEQVNGARLVECVLKRVQPIHAQHLKQSKKENN